MMIDDMDDIDGARLLAAAMAPHGFDELEHETGESSVHFALQVQRLLDDPDAAQRWPQEIQVLRERRQARRNARSSY